MIYGIIAVCVYIVIFIIEMGKPKDDRFWNK